VTNFLPAARTRLKIDVEDIRAVNPDIIYVRGTALGVRGPEAAKGGYDQPTFWCRSGGAAGISAPEIGGVLGMPAPAFGDSIGGMTIAGGISAALFARERTGEPSVVDVSLLSVGAWANGLAVDLSLLNGAPWPAAVPEHSGGRVHNPLVGNFRTADGRYLNLNMMQPGRYWPDFCKHIDRPDLAEDARFDSAEKLIENYAIAAELIGTLAGQWAPIQNSVEVGQDVQLRANGFIAEVLDVDGEVRELVTAPVQFDEQPAKPSRGPEFAEHTEQILAELGRDEQAILRLRLDGAVT
jgi:crotonobetainyl-CoA:carnitine CoA-transferase CaiB-like acyl-CoA transferase